MKTRLPKTQKKRPCEALVSRFRGFPISDTIQRNPLQEYNTQEPNQ